MNEIQLQFSYQRHADGSIHGTHRILPDIPELRTILDAICSWRLRDLATCALERRGYGNTDGGFGVTYPGDQDDSDRAESGPIPDGCVEVYGFWGAPDGEEYQVPEALYLEVVALVLAAKGLSEDSHRVDQFRQELGSG